MDPFLLAHHVDTVRYDISSNLSPISIKDQMLRASNIVERALHAKLIATDRPLLVVGAGVAGVLAALTALERGVPTTLIERRELFGTLKRAKKRYVCPTQYEWPMPHYLLHKFPWGGSTMTLTWNAGNPTEVLGSWAQTVYETEGINSDFHLFDHTVLKKKFKVIPNKTDPLLSHVKVYFAAGPEPHPSPRPRPSSAVYGMIISCVGFGKERCTVGNYTGYEFWGNDNFTRKNVGIEDESVVPNVLISGGGDGALQDFLRISTNSSCAHDVYQQLPFDIKERVVKAITYAEDCAQRELVWNSVSMTEDHHANRLLHRQHKIEIGNLVADTAVWDKIEAALQGVVKDFSRELSVKLAFPCDHFSSCYALNRFLVLLVAEFIFRRFRISVLYPNTKVMNVSGTSHTCVDPESCHGKDHQVNYVIAVCQNFKTAEASYSTYPDFDGGPFNVVIIRHGVIPPASLFGKSPIANGRQILPYYVRE